MALVELIAASHLGVTTITNDGVVTWTYTPPDPGEDDPAVADQPPTTEE